MERGQVEDDAAAAPVNDDGELPLDHHADSEDEGEPEQANENVFENGVLGELLDVLSNNNSSNGPGQVGLSNNNGGPGQGGSSTTLTSDSQSVFMTGATGAGFEAQPHNVYLAANMVAPTIRWRGGSTFYSGNHTQVLGSWADANATDQGPLRPPYERQSELGGRQAQRYHLSGSNQVNFMPFAIQGGMNTLAPTPVHQPINFSLRRNVDASSTRPVATGVQGGSAGGALSRSHAMSMPNSESRAFSIPEFARGLPDRSPPGDMPGVGQRGCSPRLMAGINEPVVNDDSQTREASGRAKKRKSTEDASPVGPEGSHHSASVASADDALLSATDHSRFRSPGRGISQSDHVVELSSRDARRSQSDHGTYSPVNKSLQTQIGASYLGNMGMPQRLSSLDMRLSQSDPGTCSPVNKSLQTGIDPSCETDPTNQHHSHQWPPILNNEAMMQQQLNQLALKLRYQQMMQQQQLGRAQQPVMGERQPHVESSGEFQSGGQVKLGSKGKPDTKPPARRRKSNAADIPVPRPNEIQYSASLDLLAQASAKRRSLKSQSDESDIGGPLIFPDDKELVTDWFYYLMDQLMVCRISEEDRNTLGGQREHRQDGFGGLQCIHCSGVSKPRKFFWDSPSRYLNSFSEIKRHVQCCEHCPEEVKRALFTIKWQHEVQIKTLRRGSQKDFWFKMWGRLNPDYPPEESEDT